MKKMMNNEQYENLIALLKKALEFYGDKENYLFYSHKDAPIALDEGSQARFALDKIKELQKLNDEMLEDYAKNAEAMTNEMSDDEIMKAIEKLKQI
jgi:hypothetical protein